MYSMSDVTRQRHQATHEPQRDDYRPNGDARRKGYVRERWSGSDPGSQHQYCETADRLADPGPRKVADRRGFSGGVSGTDGVTTVALIRGYSVPSRFFLDYGPRASRPTVSKHLQERYRGTADPLHSATPDFLSRLVSLAHFMRLSSQKSRTRGPVRFCAMGNPGFIGELPVRPRGFHVPGLTSNRRGG